MGLLLYVYIESGPPAMVKKIKQRSSYTPYHSNILTGYEPGLNALPVRNRSIFVPVEHDVFLLVETNWRPFFSTKTAFKIVTRNKNSLES